MLYQLFAIPEKTPFDYGYKQAVIIYFKRVGIIIASSLFVVIITFGISIYSTIFSPQSPLANLVAVSCLLFLLAVVTFFCGRSPAQKVFTQLVLLIVSIFVFRAAHYYLLGTSSSEGEIFEPYRVQPHQEQPFKWNQDIQQETIFLPDQSPKSKLEKESLETNLTNTLFDFLLVLAVLNIISSKEVYKFLARLTRK